MSFGLGCQFARKDFRPPFERTADACYFGRGDVQRVDAEHVV